MLAATCATDAALFEPTTLLGSHLTMSAYAAHVIPQTTLIERKLEIVSTTNRDDAFIPVLTELADLAFQTAAHYRTGAKGTHFEKLNRIYINLGHELSVALADYKRAINSM